VNRRGSHFEIRDEISLGWRATMSFGVIINERKILALCFCVNDAHGFNFAERLSSAINVLGAEYAARSIIRDKHVYSL
jgi:hypothetical protein